jgi:hypothetical protein
MLPHKGQHFLYRFDEKSCNQAVVTNNVINACYGYIFFLLPAKIINNISCFAINIYRGF